MLLCVRTTITMEEDVAAAIDRMRRAEARSLRDVINELLRLGLSLKERPMEDGPRFQTGVGDTGRPLLPNVDNVADVLDLIEPEWPR
jgi:hypothetical protein